MIIMVVGLAAASANSILNVYRNTAYAAIATVFVQLHTADPGAAGVTAVSVGSTTRNQATWNAAAAGAMTISALAAWTNAGTTETISHISLWTLSSAGVFLQSAALSVAQAWLATNTLTLTTFTFSYTPIAA
jgi:hypothetical protein